MATIPSKELLEDLYLNNTNVVCCYKLGVTQVTLLRWLDYHEIKKKGSPEQRKGIDHNKIMKNWWFSDKKWSRVIDYNGRYFFQNEWRNIGFFYNIKWAPIPREIDPDMKSEIYCTRCMQYLSPLEFAPAFQHKESGRCSRCESERIRFYNDKNRLN